MPESTEQTVEPVSQPDLLRSESPKQQKPPDRLLSDHGGAWTVVHEASRASAGEEPPPEQFAPIFRSPLLSTPANESQRARVLGSLQQTYGNRYVNRLLSESGASHEASSVQRDARSGEVPANSPPAVSSSSHPLDSSARAALEPKFGRDLSAVRVHTDSGAQKAADRYNANAFTTGNDIYFGAGQYNPSSPAGRGLLAHELTHVVQQSNGSVSPGVSQPSDPHEQQAYAVQNAVTGGAPMPDVPGGGRPAAIQRQANAAPAAGGARGGGGPGEPAGAVAGPGDFLVSIAGIPAVLPLERLVRRLSPGDQLTVKLPNSLVKFSLPGVKGVSLVLDLDESKKPVSGSITAKVDVPKLKGDVTGTIDKQGNASGAFDVEVGIPGLKRTAIRGGIDPQKWWVEGDAAFEIAKVSGSVHYAYKEGKHSGKAKGKYSGAKFTGEIEIVVAETGDVSGSGHVDAELFKKANASADVAIDEKQNVKIAGTLRVPGEVKLFDEKKYEKSFFNFSRKFPLWGITIPVVDVNVGLFAEIFANAGFRAKFGPGVIRGVALSGEYGTDPETVTEVGLTAEFFLPAAAEIVMFLGGSVGLGLLIADISGGLMAYGVAGLYGALSVKPTLKYSGGKYTLAGTAEIGGVAQLKLGINAFAEIEVGVWRLKKTVWERQWKLAEWIWNTGLNVALRANVSYTLGEDFTMPDVSFESGSLDPEKLVADAMPSSGEPVPAPAKPPKPDKASFQVEGAQGGQQPGAAPAEAPSPGAPGNPPVKTQAAQGPVAAPGADAAGLGSPEEALPPAPASLGILPEKRTEEEDWQAYQYDIVKANASGAAGPPVQRARDGMSPRRRNLEEAFAAYEGAAMSFNAFKEKFKTEYYDDKNDKWIPRKFRVPRGTSFAIPLTADKEDAEFLVPQEKTSSRKQHKPRDPVRMYQAKARGDGLIGMAEEEREDVRDRWKKLYPKPSPYYPWDEEDVDHILELQVGGANDDDNLQLLPASDNRSSGSSIRQQIVRHEELAQNATSLSNPIIKWTKAKMV